MNVSLLLLFEHQAHIHRPCGFAYRRACDGYGAIISGKH